MTWKKMIKKLLPDKVVYGYEVIRTVPEYLKALNVKSQIPDIKFYSDEETVSLIVKERKSLSRFGDGEFMWMSGESMASNISMKISAMINIRATVILSRILQL